MSDAQETLHVGIQGSIRVLASRVSNAVERCSFASLFAQGFLLKPEKSGISANDSTGKQLLQREHANVTLCPINPATFLAARMLHATYSTAA